MPTFLLENQGIIEPKIPEKNCLNFRKVSTNPQIITQEQKPFAKLAAIELFPVVRKQKKRGKLNLMVCGEAGTGKSGFLEHLIYTLSEEDYANLQQKKSSTDR
jgi:hypothetical protein